MRSSVAALLIGSLAVGGRLRVPLLSTATASLAINQRHACSAL